MHSLTIRAVSSARFPALACVGRYIQKRTWLCRMLRTFFLLLMRKMKRYCIDTFMINKSDWHLLGDVARIFGCKPHRIVYLLSSGQVPEPALRLGNRRIFTGADIDNLAEKLGINRQGKKHER